MKRSVCAQLALAAAVLGLSGCAAISNVSFSGSVGPDGASLELKADRGGASTSSEQKASATSQK
jgi:hypothetical protein